MTDKKIEFIANIGNKTVVLSGEVRLSGGKNIMKESTIRKHGIDKFPGVEMPKDWRSDSPIGKTSGLMKSVKVSENKVNLETKAAEVCKKLSKDMKPKWSPSKIAAMDVKRAKKEIDGQSDINKLIELYQFVRSKKELRTLVENKAYVLDPNCPFIGKPRAKMNPDPSVD